jgi:uncharacterized protein (TIGR02646 family)
VRKLHKPGHPLTLPLRAPSSVRPPEEGEPDTLSFSALQAIFDRRRAANPATAPRSLFDTLLDKAAARRALHEEQAGRCAFCERQVQPVAPASSKQKPAAMRVAHWRPLSALPARALDWNNLFGSCHAGGAEPHCDLAQGDTDPVLPDDQAAPSPSGADYASWLKLLPDGTLEPVAEAPAYVAFVVLMLNLNAPNLKSARATAVSAIQEHMERRWPGRDVPRSALQQLLDDVHRAPEFPTARRLWLARRLARSS